MQNTPLVRLSTPLESTNPPLNMGLPGLAAQSPQNIRTDTRLVGDASKWPARLFERAVLSGIDDHGKPLKSAMPHWQNASLKSDHGVAPTRAEIKAIQHYLNQIK